MRNKNKPWLDESGKPLSDDHLKITSKYWSAEDWEDYLQTQEVNLKEDLLNPRFYDELAARQNETVFQKFYFSPDPEAHKFIESIFSILSPTQRNILEEIYLEGRTERHIADKLGLPHTTIHFHKKNALSQIKRHLEQVLCKPPYIGKSEKNLKDAFQKIDELYAQGSLTKDERFLLWALVEVGGLKGGI